MTLAQERRTQDDGTIFDLAGVEISADPSGALWIAAERTLVAVDDPEAPVALDELRLGLSMLPAEQREALILVGAGGFAYEEAADICGCAVGTVKSRVSRARRAVQQILEKGAYDRDGAPAGDAMRSILADAERLSGPR